MEASRTMKWLGLIATCLLLLAGSAFGQSITLESVTGLHGVDTVLVGTPITFFLRVTGDASNHGGITNGFRVYSPDGAQWGSTVGDTLPLGWPTFFDLIFSINSFSTDGMGADTLGFGGSKAFGTGLPAGFDAVSYKITIGPIDPSNHGKTIVLDSSFYPPIGTWKWAGPVAFPSWDGPHVFKIFDPNAPPVPGNLVLSTDSLAFTGLQGGAQPAAQTFDINSDQGPLNFNLVESTSWLVPTPILGTTPRTINVAVNTIGLLAGTYLDSIEVTSPTAPNSPQWVKVSLVLTPPPPTISVSPSSFIFNAIAGGSNPADKILTIENIGQSQLNWTVTNSQPWLSLAPASGTDSGQVTLSVDITGLAFGDYYDTIVVSDPAATNNPKSVPVTLTVASDLPMIAVDSSFNYIIVPAGVSTVPSRDINIYNSGAGSFNFTLQESSPRILSLTPNTGTAPQVVTVGFKVSGGTVGNDYFDTLWVNSSEATNSPYPVVFQFHYVQNPAILSLSSHTLNLNVYECDQGYNRPMPVAFLSVSNVGGDSPVLMKLLYESDYFTVDIDSGILPQFITVEANQLRLPLGTYVDTILVTAQKANNSPQVVIVNYNVVPGTLTPEISIVSDQYTIPTQENEGPLQPIAYQIYNRYGGCMEWEVQENIPWFYPDPDSGNVPQALDMNVNAVGIPFGQYVDSFFIVAPTASNSPKKVTLNLKVWRFHGDVDYNAEINIADMVYLVEYMFQDGPAPQPERRVGDLNCNLLVDIADLVYMVDYFFNEGPIPCGNPY